MLVITVDNYDSLSRRAARIVARAILNKPNLTLGLATGDTPIGLYRQLVRLHREEGLDFADTVTFNLDEYFGISPDHPQSFHSYMRRHLFNHVNIQPQNVHIPDGTVDGNFEAYCSEYEMEIQKAGGIDLQVLGIGKTGHIGFNEPTSSLASRTRVKTLTAETIEDNRKAFGQESVPPCAITMGIGTILEARRIVLLASGKSKSAAVAAAIEGPLTASVTASALQLHRDVLVLLDRDAASNLIHKDYYDRVLEMTLKLTPGILGDSPGEK